MKTTFFTLFALLLTALTIGGLLNAAAGRDAPSIIFDLGISAFLAWAAWANWKYVAQLRTPRAAQMEDPQERPWGQRER